MKPVIISMIFIFGLVMLIGAKPKWPLSVNPEEPWNSSQLLAPADLAKMLAEPSKKQPIVFCIGPGALIKGSIDIGPAKDSSNLKKFQSQLSQLPKDSWIVIYCGCCPFEHCPNVRPAFRLLNQLKFTNHKLLNLEHNIRTDWVNMGYPVTK
jgi:thiosulfate/3-mercaptopyruvate sulfurtransferase